MSRPGIEPGPPAWEASTLDSLFAGYSEPLLELRWRSARGLYRPFKIGRLTNAWDTKIIIDNENDSVTEQSSLSEMLSTVVYCV